tara:strand:- start:152 stop:580 length:429 start_codon:yes stop_codon:yes gene_type:complete
MSIQFDDDKDVRIGVNLPFTRDNKTGWFDQSFTTLDAAKSNLRNLLLTMKGERIMQPNFGTDLMKLVFEQDDGTMTDRIRETIIDAVDFWLPYLNLNTVEVNNSVETDDMNHNRFNVKLVFSIRNVPDKFETITFSLNATNL